MGRGNRQWSKTRRTRDGGKVRVTKYGPSRGRSSGCFPSTARVLTPTGWREIGTLQAGDLIMSFCLKRKALVCRSVIRRIDRGVSEMWAIQTDSHGSAITVTKGHSFLTQRGWVWTRNLRPGDTLVVAGAPDRVTTKIANVCSTEEYVPTHNLRTEGECNFIVENLIAHNFSFLRTLRRGYTNAAQRLRMSFGSSRRGDEEAQALPHNRLGSLEGTLGG
jgi:hypothetical protein